MTFPLTKPVRLLAHVAVCLLALPLAAQSTMGKSHLRVTDPRGSGMKASVQIVSEANQYDGTFATDDSGVLVAKRLPFGLYDVRVEKLLFDNRIVINNHLQARPRRQGLLHAPHRLRDGAGAQGDAVDELLLRGEGRQADPGQARRTSTSASPSTW